jgi:hypothetical protein
MWIAVELLPSTGRLQERNGKRKLRYKIGHNSCLGLSLRTFNDIRAVDVQV